MTDLLWFILFEAFAAMVVVLGYRSCSYGREGPAAGAHTEAQERPPAPAPELELAKLPYFPYAPRGGGAGGGGGRASSESTSTLVCAICLEQLRRGEPCSEVPACRHVFHGDCVALWMKRSNACPLCRAKISSWTARPPPIAAMV